MRVLCRTNGRYGRLSRIAHSGPRTMRTICLAVFFTAVALAAADAQPSAADPQRHGIPAVLPPDWIVQPTDPNGHRKLLTSPDGSASLTTLEERAGPSVASYMQSVAARPGERVTYQRRGQ